MISGNVHAFEVFCEHDVGELHFLSFLWCRLYL